MAPRDERKLWNTVSLERGSMRDWMDLLPSAAYACDARGRIVSYNRRAVELWGREPRIAHAKERFCGASRRFQGRNNPIAVEDTPMAIAIRLGKTCRNADLIIERPDGSRIPVRLSTEPILNGKGTPRGAITVFEDISELKGVEQRLEIQYEVTRILSEGRDLKDAGPKILKVL